MAILAANSTPAMILSLASPTGQFKAFPGIRYNIEGTGTFDGATATLQTSADQGTTWTDVPNAAWTQAYDYDHTPTAPLSRIILTGSGAGTAITIAAVPAAANPQPSGRIRNLTHASGTLTLNASNAGSDTKVFSTGASAFTILPAEDLPYNANNALVWIITQSGAGVGSVDVFSGMTLESAGSYDSNGQHTTMILSQVGFNSYLLEGAAP